MSRLLPDVPRDDLGAHRPALNTTERDTMIQSWNRFDTATEYKATRGVLTGALGKGWRQTSRRLDQIGEDSESIVEMFALNPNYIGDAFST